MIIHAEFQKVMDIYLLDTLVSVKFENINIEQSGLIN